MPDIIIVVERGHFGRARVLPMTETGVRKLRALLEVGVDNYSIPGDVVEEMKEELRKEGLDVEIR